MSGMKFDNPAFRKEMAMKQQKQMKEFSVPDASDDHVQDQFMREQEEFSKQRNIEQAREEKIDPMKARLSKESKSRIELLTGIGKMTRDVDIEGTIFTLRTLKSIEFKEITKAAFLETMQVNFLIETRRQTLARSLYQIAGYDLEYILDDDSVETCLNYIDQLDDAVVSRLQSEYEILRAESIKKFGIVKQEELKEVLEDIKKS